MDFSETRSESIKPRVLIVDDRPENLLALERLLDDMPLETVRANSGNEALKLMLEQDFALVLLDVQMPGMDGFETAKLMRENQRTENTPIIFVTAISKEERYVAKGHELGAVDYLFKPIDPVILKSKVTVFVELYAQKAKLKGLLSELSDAQITLEQRNKQLDKLARLDVVTKLPNRLQFEESLAQVLASSQRHNRRFALLFLDLDNFKYINDTFGHDCGDEVLQVAANRISQCVRQDDVVSRSIETGSFAARLGGDEFVVILTEIQKQTVAANVARRIVAAMSESIQLKETEVKIGVSIGIALFPEAGDDVDTLCKHADVAMYRAKQAGKNNYQYFSKELNEAYKQKFIIETQLRKAIKTSELNLVFQPIYQLDSESIVGAEVLIRWHSSVLGDVSPAEFIPVAEDMGVIAELGEWVIKEALESFANWEKQACALAYCTINVSLQQLKARAFVEFITKTLKETKIDSGNIMFELTETAVMEDPESTKQILNILTDLGVKICIDNFGTGYSSLSRLQELPITALKIAREFIADDRQKNEGMTIAASILALAANLNLSAIAGGIETEEQMNVLKLQGCQLGQGHYFGSPLSAREMQDKLLKQVHKE
jgi:diguanylate cyclase